MLTLIMLVLIAVLMGPIAIAEEVTKVMTEVVKGDRK